MYDYNTGVTLKNKDIVLTWKEDLCTGTAEVYLDMFLPCSKKDAKVILEVATIENKQEIVDYIKYALAEIEKRKEEIAQEHDNLLRQCKDLEHNIEWQENPCNAYFVDIAELKYNKSLLRDKQYNLKALKNSFAKLKARREKYEKNLKYFR